MKKLNLIMLGALCLAPGLQAQVVREFSAVWWNTGTNNENTVAAVGGGLTFGGQLSGSGDSNLASTDIIYSSLWDSSFSSWVLGGGVYIVHDWGNGATALPGLGGATPGSHNWVDLNVLDASHPIVQGPFGTINNTLLDGGSASLHGAWAISSLVSTDGQVGTINSVLSSYDANSVAVFEFSYGAGHIIYANIPLEAYTDSNPLVTGPQPAGLQVYAANELAFAASLTDFEQPVPEVQHYAGLLGLGLFAAETVRRRRAKA